MSDSVRNACDGVITLLRHGNPSRETIAMAIVLLERYRDEQKPSSLPASSFHSQWQGDTEFQPR